MIEGHPIHILINSGSTHNFLDLALVSKLGCTVEQVEPQAVTVAGGSHIACQSKCPKFQWQMNGHKFEADTLLISLGGCDMVLPMAEDIRANPMGF